MMDTKYSSQDYNEERDDSLGGYRELEPNRTSRCDNFEFCSLNGNNDLKLEIKNEDLQDMMNTKQSLRNSTEESYDLSEINREVLQNRTSECDTFEFCSLKKECSTDFNIEFEIKSDDLGDMQETKNSLQKVIEETKDFFEGNRGLVQDRTSECDTFEFCSLKKEFNNDFNIEFEIKSDDLGDMQETKYSLQKIIEERNDFFEENRGLVRDSTMEKVSNLKIEEGLEIVNANVFDNGYYISDNEWMSDEEQEGEHLEEILGVCSMEEVGDPSNNVSKDILSKELSSILESSYNPVPTTTEEDLSKTSTEETRTTDMEKCVLLTGKTFSKKRAKKHCCLFCGTMVINIPRHLKSKHADETRVQEAIKSSKDILSRRGQDCKFKAHSAFEHLRKEGDFNYNKCNPSDIIPVRESSKPKSTSWNCCPVCNGYFSRKSFRSHFKNCRYRKEKHEIVCSIKNIAGESRVRGQIISKNASDALVKYFFPYFHKTEQTDVLFRDETAVKYGNKLVSKYYRCNATGNQHIRIASQLRLLADIFATTKKLNPEIESIAAMIHCQYYEDIIKAIQIRCGYKDGLFKSPSTASNCCTLLSNVTKFLRSEALKNIDEKETKILANFENLLINIQNGDVHTLGRELKKQSPCQKTDVLPSTQEINSLLKILENEIVSAYNAALKQLSRKTYTTLSKTTMVYLMVFNRKRSEEIEIIEIESMTKVNREHLVKRENDDKNQVEQIWRYITQGISNKQSLILLPTETEKCMEFLISNREFVGIPQSNTFIFARLGTNAESSPFFKADDSLRSICLRNGLDYCRLKVENLRNQLLNVTASMSIDIRTVIGEFLNSKLTIYEDKYQRSKLNMDIAIVTTILTGASGQKDQDLYKTSAVDDNGSLIKESNVHKDKPLEEIDVADSSLSEYAQTSCSNLIKSTPFEVLMKPDISNVVVSPEEFLSGKLAPSQTLVLSDVVDKKIMATTVFKKTWSTQEKKEARCIFESFISKSQLPTLHEIQNILNEKKTIIRRSTSLVRSWLQAEISRNKANKKIITRGWTASQRHKLRRLFKDYFELYKRSSERTYPSQKELEEVLREYPEFKGKNAASIRSKIQHEFKIMDKNKK